MSNLDSFGKTLRPSNVPHPLLLVSVATPDEAALAMNNGVDWIDLKNPSAGSLGAPELYIATQTLSELSLFPHRSIALGELIDLGPNLDQVPVTALVGSHALRYPIAKVGLAHVSSMNDWECRLQQLQELIAPTQLVPVLYADGSRCGAPSLADITKLAESQRPPFVLVDTFYKDGNGLFDWLDVDLLRNFKRRIELAGSRLVLAGSLRWKDLPDLQHVAPDVIALRGAVCSQPSNRTSNLCVEKIRQWSHAIGSWHSDSPTTAIL